LQLGHDPGRHLAFWRKDKARFQAIMNLALGSGGHVVILSPEPLHPADHFKYHGYEHAGLQQICDSAYRKIALRLPPLFGAS